VTAGDTVLKLTEIAQQADTEAKHTAASLASAFNSTRLIACPFR
jgi:hypothetical protein